MKYPADFVSADLGWCRIHRGHGLEVNELLADLTECAGSARRDGEETIVEQVHLYYQPRIKWCGRHGDPCDNEGEWHGHWFAARPSTDTAFTLVYWGRPKEAAA
ncbi:hypothetical protein [Mycobacteroides abscessus]|uniref:hypothetical protein n=1 Tax=Mycobacteroides abscessus TaxID=36809 RepID=UPI00092AF135|nr:hypothetical protein [Mycobacteroides abscessus]SII73883.1 Uncharacterised protein [Mycobacteroides abscessus subsp. abscessus]SII80264.1 Uncharacterised protein [Mycobacteroides abscessus subsp. abscessus]SIM48198.1 Uncharacterised protein [Mycobacteroides abscessus subsp. abscessus]SLH87180.1 Uncharacterised protein [Mycobacteroides abscessus subsp. abscessus]SLI80906.1 Uncharacterised protein [Mycobacteroides abscessus subsp. abscessus]